MEHGWFSLVAEERLRPAGVPPRGGAYRPAAAARGGGGHDAGGENDLSGNARSGLDRIKSGGYMPAQAGSAGCVGV
jgi:hypothetical protein